ncbi:MAG: UvrD-helicase domain-containing protein [Bacilli bacterium]|nr:UvrD-helicase domain-containing protein [Bacilli bacterium]
MTRWTEEQNLAINEEGKNIIVSAGAGSGKTAVLTERVLRKLRNGISINELLILTFTNKAAYEMKERIRKGIEKEDNLKRELDFIDSSYITTFDSFALSMVKKYSYILNIGKNVKIADTSMIYLERKRILDEIFDRLYQEKNEKFLKLLNDFTIKKDDDIKNYILDINNKLELKYDKNEYLDNYIDSYYSKEYIKLLIDKYLHLINEKKKEINNLLKEISNFVDSEYFIDLKEVLDGLFGSTTYEEIKKSLEIKLPMMKKGSLDEAKTIKEEITKELDNLKELTRFDNIDELKTTLKSGQDYIGIIIQIIKELSARLDKFKTDLNIYEFTDISKMAIRILKENENIRDELKDTFKEIMIDEYQDTSDLQETFINMIDNNNVYMVGDIKQSIYRFRNANPYLFKNKYDNYNKNIGGLKIDLTKNFRSREEVISNINLLFSNLMTDFLGGADYIKSHKMVFGNTSYIEEGKTEQKYNMDIYNYEYDKESEYTKEELEIFFIANDIKEKINNNYQIFDKDEKCLRNITYKDFAILLDKSTNFDLYKKIFEYLNIPMTKYNTTNITEEIEIYLIKNIIKLLLNRKDRLYDVEFKYSFTSIARSYLFELSDEEIFNCIKNNNYESNILSIIDKIVEKLDGLSLKEIIYEIIDKFDFYNKMILVGDVKNRINRITSIINLFESLSEINYTLEDVYKYLDELITDNYKIEIKDLDIVDNSVKIMTIHASKGLEFPICYFASLYSKFNIKELNEKFMYNDKYGIVTPYFKEGIGKTFIKDLVKDDYIKEEISEKIRLFYVALTRAKEKIIIVSNKREKVISTLIKARSFQDMLDYSRDIINPFEKEIDVSKLELSHDYNLIKKTNYKNKIKKSKERIEIKEISLENSELHKEKISKETKEILDKQTKEKMKFGTKMHEILENIDFKNPNFDNLEIDNYYKDRIKKFISVIKMNEVKNIYKEYEFFYEEKDNLYHGIIDLILEYDDVIKIIDYKLKNIEDENYLKQLENYKNYISKKTNKKIEIYLFSILNGNLNKIS